ncbi:MAG TPA: DUF4402 domain-containing protein [Prolixibacteraceae bacterium]|nr:DUF4402 domain-containing protein [Prolixibacteraceae bacterium]
MKKLFILAFVVLGLSGVSFGQSTETKAVSATAKIISPLTVTKTGDIIFGSIVPDLTAGTVDISTDATATRTPSGAIACIGTFSNAKFTVGGETLSTYSVSLPATVTLTDGVGTNMIGTLSMSANAAGNQIATADFYVGASLAVGTAAAQLAGDYTGTFDVTVSYE